MSFQHPKAIFHIGNPTAAKPHHDLSTIQKCVKDNPDWALIIIVDNDQEQKALDEKLKEVKFPEFHPGGLIASWTDDTEMMDILCRDLHFVQMWRVVGPAWYECEDGHITPPTLGQPRVDCPTCQKGIKFVKHNEGRVNRFTEILKNSVSLMNFDTRSGEALQQGVNPTGNVLRNMPLALGCPGYPALKLGDFVGKGKDKPAFVIGAGPSLNDAIPHLKRLQDEATIISVARTFKLLQAEGIRVDYTISCEMFDWDSVIFDGVTKEMAGETVFGYPTVCAPATVEKWPGKRLCLWDANSAELVGIPHSMMGGNSVAHVAFNLAAEVLQSQPVILVGVDLGYCVPGPTHANGSGHNFPVHAKGSEHTFPVGIKEGDEKMQQEDWGPCTCGKGAVYYPEVHKQNTIIMGGAITPVGPIVVRTSPAYKNFGTLFEILISRTKRKTYNACLAGLKISGTIPLDLPSVTTLKEAGL